MVYNIIIMLIKKKIKMLTQKNEEIIKTLFNELNDNNLIAIYLSDFFPITLDEMLNQYRKGRDIFLYIETSKSIHVGEIDFVFTESGGCIKYSDSLTNVIPKTILKHKEIKMNKEQVEKLKKDWEQDPTWDLEKTEGFENYHDELLAYRLQREKKWKEKFQADITERAKSLNCSAELIKYLKFLEQRIDELEEQITK